MGNKEGKTTIQLMKRAKFMKGPRQKHEFHLQVIDTLPGGYRVGDTVHILKEHTVANDPDRTDGIVKAGMPGTVMGYHNESSLRVSFAGVVDGRSVLVPLAQIERGEFNQADRGPLGQTALLPKHNLAEHTR